MMGVSRSGFYKWLHAEPSQQELRKLKVIERIQFHYYDNEKRYGSPKITKLLVNEGYDIAERTVGIYMNEQNLRSCVTQKFKVRTTDSNHNDPIAPNVLNQNFKVLEPEKVWVTDYSD